MLSDTYAIVYRAWKTGTAVPGFNIPYLPMMAPVVKALRDADAFGLIMVARLEWLKFAAGGLEAIRDEYEKCRDDAHTRLHLDHVPVIDEDRRRVDYAAVIGEALALGYRSVMIDGSRLPLAENIAATREIVEMAHAVGVPVEAELGAVLGHESGPLPSYEELFASGEGFTDPEEAGEFAEKTGVDWLSVAIGNIHGAIAAATKDRAKPEARLNIDRLREIGRRANVPLVLHGGSGVRVECLREAFRNGVAKINVATSIRQPYERAAKQSVKAGQEAVYRAAMDVLVKELNAAGSATKLMRQEDFSHA